MNADLPSFPDDFFRLTGHSPMRWQHRLFDQLIDGKIPIALDLPTGLGKTSVIAIWLLARAHGANLPRRLVYVVDRRAVVDQATAEAEKLRKALAGDAKHLKEPLGLGDGGTLPISTLRGQYVDNREWLDDPAAPAIIVGTVDMIGSRLLFEGYGVSRKMRPYHAGLLGADTLIVLDEAHLVPPFEKLLETIACRGGEIKLHPVDAEDRKMVPPFKLLSLSATGRDRKGETEAFRLEAEDWDDAVVARRLNAPKTLTIDTVEASSLADRLAAEAWRLTREGTVPIRCVIYCHRRDDAEKVKVRLDKLAHGKRGREQPAEELFVGARRVKEREDANNWLKRHGFFAGWHGPRWRPAILIATSAGEVGVDLNADHIVCDLVPWERMVQRLGRVNRRGERDDTKVLVIDGVDTKKDEQLAKTLGTTRELLTGFREIDGGGDASPGALLAIREQAGSEKIKAASTPEPLHPALTRALVDAWSMTSLEHHTGRPEIAPWLRGWIENEKPQTSVVWRKYLPVRTRGEASSQEVNDFFEAAPPHASEILETDTWRVIDWLIARAASVPKAGRRKAESDDEADGEESRQPVSEPLDKNDIIAFALTPTREVKKSAYDGSLLIYSMSDFTVAGDALANKVKVLIRDLAEATIVLDGWLAGLSGGMLDKGANEPPRTADDGNDWLPLVDGRPAVRFQVHPPADEEKAESIIAAARAHEIHRFATKRSDDGDEEEVLLVETWTTENSRATSPNPQLLTDHQSCAERKALAIAHGVGLSGDERKALGIAARLHDEGKKALRWQRAFRAPRDAKRFGLAGPLAKTRGPIDQKTLYHYRHEFGSLPYAQDDAAFKELQRRNPELAGLVLHLIAAHHGGARPVIDTRGCEDAPPSALEERARDVALRFATLQKRWGPWGLAWWEALLRAADQQASRENDKGEGPGAPHMEKS